MRVSLPGGITFKLTLWVLGLTSLIFVALIWYNYSYARWIVLRDAEQSARNLTLSMSRAIEQDFRSVTKIVQSLALALEANPCHDDKDLLRLIRGTVSRNREVFGSTVAYVPYAFHKNLRLFAPYYFKSSDGVKLVELSQSYDYTKKDWFHIPEVLGKPVWTQPYYDEGGGNILMVTYSVPFFDRAEGGSDRKLLGIVTADISLNWLEKVVSKAHIGQTGHCFVISDTGVFVTSPRKELVMRESVFSLAEERHLPRLRRIGRRMMTQKQGFLDMGASLTGRDSYLAFARIPSTGWVFATVYPKDELFFEAERLLQRTFLIAVAGILALFVAAFVIARSMARPLRRMAEATERVGTGDLDIDLSDIRRNDEVGQLAQGFMRMTEGLRERNFIRDTFGRYLTREVVERLLESEDGLKLGGESRNISMLMSDLRGFTALTSHMPADQIIEVLNRYLGEMLDILIDHRGTVDEIIGDGILAFFGAPEPLEDHPARAVACALNMQKAMEVINERNEGEGLPCLEMGIAVNTGRVVVGNIGSERRAKYGAVGSEVNFTGRIESFTIGGQVLISQSTYERVADMVDVRESFRVRMKGIAEEVVLYDVRGIGGSFNVSLKDHDDTLAPLPSALDVKVFRLDEKIVKGNWLQASITAVSPLTARMALADEVARWENLRIELMDDRIPPAKSQIYGKVVSVSRRGDRFDVIVRITSAQPEVRTLFREAVSQPEKEPH